MFGSCCCRDYRKEWEKIRAEAEAKKAEEKVVPKENLVGEVSVGRELSDIYLRHPANESSTDSEGEEVDVKEDDEEAETFRKVMEQQKELQIKRAKEAEERKKKAEAQ